MTQPNRYLMRMIGFLIAVLVVAGLLYSPIIRAFSANYLLNGLIVLVLLFGISYCFRQVIRLRPEVDWIELFRRAEPGLSMQRAPELLAPMAAMLGERQGRVMLSTMSMRSLLDSIASRLDEGREISRYLIGLLVFLGLLGTFWGLLETVSSVGTTISSLSPAASDFAAFFDELQAGLQAPLDGMGIAFSSSLFGLAGSLILGFLDLQAGQAQNRFYNELEEWLSENTRLSSGSGIADGDQSVPVYVQALLEQTADSLDNLQRIIARSEDSRGSGQNALIALTDRLSALTDTMQSEQGMMLQIAEQHLEMRPILQRLAQVNEQSGGMDEASRNHIRNIDVYMMRLLEEMTEGREQMVQDIRSEIKLLARTIAALADDGR